MIMIGPKTNQHFLSWLISDIEENVKFLHNFIDFIILSYSRDWVYEQSDPEKQNKVFELLESVRRWTLNSSAGLGGSEDKNNIHAHQRPKIQRSRSTLGE